MDEDSLNIAVRRFLKVVGVTSQREIERIVREGKIEGTTLNLRMTLTAENTPLNHVVEEAIDLRYASCYERSQLQWRMAAHGPNPLVGLCPNRVICVVSAIPAASPWVAIDAPLPGIGPWDEIIRSPALWHFNFRGPDVERLVEGKTFSRT